MPGWIGVDLDGTLAHHGSWREGHIGEPIVPMVDRVKKWLSEGQDVRIFTARAPYPDACELIELWCLEHLGARLKITATKDFSMIALWDDRCVQVVPNTGQPVDPTLA